MGVHTRLSIGDDLAGNSMLNMIEKKYFPNNYQVTTMIVFSSLLGLCSSAPVTIPQGFAQPIHIHRPISPAIFLPFFPLFRSAVVAPDDIFTSDVSELSFFIVRLHVADMLLLEIFSPFIIVEGYLEEKSLTPVMNGTDPWTLSKARVR